MSAQYTELILLTSVPIAALLAGGTAAAWRTPGPRLASAVQHFTAGVVFAAVAIELLPAIIDAPGLPISLGFAAGVALMLAVARLTHEPDDADVPARSNVASMVVATSVDVLIDGLLVGIAFSTGENQGMLLAFALALELLFLGLAASSRLSRAGVSRANTLLVTSLLAVLVATGAGLGDTLLATLTGGAKTALLSFGVAALLYLVTEELLVEAHETPETAVSTSLFFFGFLAVLLLEKAIA